MCFRRRSPPCQERLFENQPCIPSIRVQPSIRVDWNHHSKFLQGNVDDSGLDKSGTSRDITSMAGIYSKTSYSRAVGWFHGGGACKSSSKLNLCSNLMFLNNTLQDVALVLRDKLLPQFFLRRYGRNLVSKSFYNSYFHRTKDIIRSQVWRSF